MTVLETILLIIEGGLAIVVGYLLLLTMAAVFAPRRTPARAGEPAHRFIILIPAHNEERLLPGMLENLRELDYPADRYQVHVIADNCSDQTAAAARAGGATVHERTNLEQRGKPFALQWALQQIWERNDPHDAVLILDADSVVSANFLRVMDARLARGERVIQAYYAVRDAQIAWSAGLRAVALTLVHYLRPQARMVLGGSAGLKGNGMVFRAEILRAHPWPTSLTEDIEYHMALILAGERAMFAPDALVWAEMPATLAGSRSQNARWERGRAQMVRQYVPVLLREALRRRSFLLFDAAVEQLIPPFSLVAAASLACLAGAVLLGSLPGLLLAGALIAGQVVYTLGGLLLAGASSSVYTALLFTPAFVLWKLWLFARMALGLEQRGWIRTARNDPS